jgi:hypothetical protein
LGGFPGAMPRLNIEVAPLALSIESLQRSLDWR